jgi:hypothetical protein
MENHRADCPHRCSEPESSRSAFKPNRSGFDLRSSQWQRRSSVFVNCSSDFKRPSSGLVGRSSVRRCGSSNFQTGSSAGGPGSSAFKSCSSISVKASSVLPSAPPNRHDLLRIQKPLLRFRMEPHRQCKMLLKNSLCIFPPGFGLRQPSAALAWPTVPKAPEGRRTPRRYRAILHFFSGSVFNPQF